MNFNEKSPTDFCRSITLMRTELVTTLKRRAAEILSERENEKAPILIKQYGKPAAYLVDAPWPAIERKFQLVARMPQ